MFGKDASAYEQVSEDEDWGPAKRRRREKESNAFSTLMTLYGSEGKCPNVKTSEAKRNFYSDPKIRKLFFRIPPSAVEKLHQVFVENELPSRTVKENLSKYLGLEPEKVSIEFSDDMSLKRLLKAKTKRDKRKVKFIPRGELQVAEAEVERLCRAKVRLEYLKQALLRLLLQTRNTKKSNKSLLHDESLIYIPIAQLGEKA